MFLPPLALYVLPLSMNLLLLLTVGFLFVGGCVGIFGRLLSRG